MDFEVGQVWTRGKGVWETGKRIVDVDRRRSVTFFKTEDKHGGDASWISADLLTAWVEDSGSSLAVLERQPRVCPACGVDHDARMSLPLRELADRMASLSDRLHVMNTAPLDIEQVSDDSDTV